MIEATVQEYLAWLEAAGHARDTVRARRANLRRFARWLAGQGVTEPTGITSAFLERYRPVAAMRQHGFPPPLTVGSQIQALLAVKRFCAWCVRQGILRTDPAGTYALPRRPHQLPRAVLSTHEVEAVLAVPDVTTPTGVRDRAILETLYSTGIRRGELTGLRAADIDTDHRTLWIRHGKGGRQRVVPIGSRALEWIGRYALTVRPRLAGVPDDGTLFLSRRGRPLKHHLSEAVHRYIGRARIGKSGGCHVFRHTMATLMLENGADVRFIQAMLGHVQLSTTALYTHVAIGVLQAVHRRTHPAECVLSEPAA
jgi:integrase/recombinase XerD